MLSRSGRPIIMLLNVVLESMHAWFFWGGDANDRRVSWGNWELVSSTKEIKGLEVGCLNAFDTFLF